MTENPQPARQPGAWPTDLVDLDAIEQGDLYVQRQQERALHELVLDSIRHDLTQQPSPNAIRAAERRWKTAITNLANDLINTRRTQR